MSKTVKGARELKRKTSDIGERLEKPQRASAKLTDTLRRRIEERFNTDGDGDWPELLAETIAKKRAAGLDTRILRATGALHDALLAGRVTSRRGQAVFRASAPGRYAYIVTHKRPILSSDESRLADEVRDALARNAMLGRP